MSPRFFVLGVCIIFAAAVLFLGNSSATLPPFHASWEDKVEFWERYITEYGGADAYYELAVRIKDAPYGEQHTWAHAFGAALFESLGEKGISVCDARFSFGCYHQFLGDAIAEQGLESIPQLNAACFEDVAQSPLSCQHGIGHGALAAIGYDRAALLKALDICRNLSGADPIGGCYGGVFMEYNVRTMLADAAEAREYSGDPFDSCHGLDTDFVPACVYWLPQWWKQTALAGTDSIDAFKEMGKYCTSFATTPELVRSCFEGIGNIIAESSGFDPLHARTLCNAVSADKRRALMCRAIGANHFGIDVSEEAADAMCADLTGDAFTYCDAYAHNRANILEQATVPTL